MVVFDFDTIGLWYNKELFNDAKLEYPDETWDWVKFQDTAAKLTDSSKGIYGFTADLWGQGGYYNTIYQNGGQVISDDKTKSGYDMPETIEGVKFWTGLIEKGISPTAAQLSETPGVTMFESGKSAMYFGGSWIQAQFGENDAIKDIVDVTVLPQGKKRATIIHGLGVAMSANTDHPEEVWKFIEFMGTKEAQEILGKSGTMIPAFNGTQDVWNNSNPNFNLKSYIDSAQEAVPLPSSQNAAKWQDKEWELLSKAWAGEMTTTIPLKIFPAKWSLDNYKDALINLPFLTFLRNTVIVALSKTLGQLMLCSMAAYAFARIKFPGRNVIFILYLSVLMIPYQIFIIPQYIIMINLSWLNSLKALIVPGLFSAFGTFLLRQAFMTLPKEIEEAAAIDGCNHFRIYWKIMMPMIVPNLVALSIFTVLASWNDLLWPLIVNNSPDKLTLAAGLSYLKGEHLTNYPVLMAGSIMAILPMILMFVVLQKYFIEGIALTGVKG